MRQPCTQAPGGPPARALDSLPRLARDSIIPVSPPAISESDLLDVKDALPSPVIPQGAMLEQELTEFRDTHKSRYQREVELTEPDEEHLDTILRIAH